MKRKTITCRCNAYKFPHRWTGGKCKANRPHQFDVPDEELEEWADYKKYRLILRESEEFEYDDYLSEAY